MDPHSFRTPTRYRWGREGDYREVETAASMLFKLVSEYGSLVARVDSRTQESRRRDTTVYPSSGRFSPYVQQLMIHILKSTKIRRLQQSVKEEDLVGRLVQC
jgi:hypothetical protein